MQNQNIYPLVTCGFTTFNSENTIQKALTSALNQDYKNIEILIVDDNSTDLTLENIYKFLSTKKIRFRVVKHNSNLGVAQARNTLLSNANGEFLAFFDSDDYSFKNRLSEQLNHIILYENNNFNKSTTLWIDIERNKYRNWLSAGTHFVAVATEERSELQGKHARP